MYYFYDNDGKYVGFTEVDLELFSDYNYVQIEPPAHSFAPDNMFKPINWAYWTGAAWELRDLE